MALVDARSLSKLAGVKLRARSLVEGVLSGLHPSPHQGQSIEFAEHKEYTPGDEVRHVDWKAYGKLDRYFVKRYEHETNLRAILAVDASGSMGYGSVGLSKLDVARVLAATLSHLLLRQQDAAGVAVFGPGGVAEVPARAAPGHLSPIVDRLEATGAGGETNLGAMADWLSERAPRRSLVLVFSDLFDFREPAGDGLRRLLALRARKHDVAIFHLLDPAEVRFPFDDATVFSSLEDQRRLEVDAREVRASYLEELERFVSGARAACAQVDVEYQRILSDEPLDAALLQFLGRRGGRR